MTEPTPLAASPEALGHSERQRAMFGMIFV
jgi:hypothetical protein